MVSLDNFWQSRQLVQATAKPCCDSRCSFVKYLLRIKIKALMRYRCERMESVRRLCYRPHPVPRAAHHTQIFRSLCKIVDKIKKWSTYAAQHLNLYIHGFQKNNIMKSIKLSFNLLDIWNEAIIVLFHVHMPIFDLYYSLWSQHLILNQKFIFYLACLLQTRVHCNDSAHFSCPQIIDACSLSSNR